MSNIDISEQANGEFTVPRLPFTYRRPRGPFKHLAQGYERLVLCPRRLARITGQAILSGSLIAGGILVGLNPIGAFLVITGVVLPFGFDTTQTPEEYRQFVISDFEKRGETPPRWTQKVKRGQVWRHRGILNLILRRNYKVISVRANVARCLVTDTDGSPIQASGKARFCDIRTFTMRYAYKLVGGAS